MASEAEAQEAMKRLLEEHSPPTIYMNGAAIGLSLSDISLTATVDGMPQCQLHMSFTTAKTVATNIMTALNDLERLSEHPVLTMDEVQEAMKPLAAQPAEGESR